MASTRRFTHSYVISELFGLGISRRHDLSSLGSFVRDILRDSDVQTIWVDEALTWRALELLNSRKDKSWSLCDAVSFVLMDNLNLTEALTTDQHFAQAGFVKLLDS